MARPNLDVSMKIVPDGEVNLRFGMNASQLASSISKEEARTLVNCLIEEHGTSVFSDVAEEVVEEYGPTPEES